MIVAFRIKADNDRNATANARYKALKTQYTLTCMAPLTTEMAAVEIGPLTGWGDYPWKVTTTNDSAQFYFDQGINMYYAYHIVEATASFNKALRIDPTFAMAWFGKGLAIGYSIQLPQNGPVPEDAREATRKGTQYAAACTPFEQTLIAAMALRFGGDSTEGTIAKMDRYTQAMAEVAKAYPNNAEALTLYADALTMKYQNTMYEKDLTPKPWTGEIKKSLQAAIAISPRHPGAHHMLVHTLQGSANPYEAMESAEILPALMPGMAHMVHMPSHIYLRTGYYNKGITINDEAIDAFNNTAKEFAPVTANGLFYSSHPWHVKAACALMSGDYTVANAASIKLREDITPQLLNIPGPFGNYMHYAYQTRIFTDVRFGKWENLLKEQPVDTLAYVSVLAHFGRGIAYARLHKLEEADKELTALETSMEAPALRTSNYQIDAFYEPASIARDILKGIIATERKQYKVAIAAFESAAATDDSTSYSEPRYWLIPARPYLGDVYLQMKNYKKAIEVFNKDLEINPGNVWALNGLVMAYTATRDTKGIRATSEKMKKAGLNADFVKVVY